MGSITGLARGARQGQQMQQAALGNNPSYSGPTPTITDLVGQARQNLANRDLAFLTPSAASGGPGGPLYNPPVPGAYQSAGSVPVTALNSSAPGLAAPAPAPHTMTAPGVAQGSYLPGLLQQQALSGQVGQALAAPQGAAGAPNVADIIRQIRMLQGAR